jgi:UDP-N-acetyl-L-fucosamine synthase
MEMRRMRVATIVGTRPEIIRLSRVMARLDECMDHVLIHTGQNYDYELNEVFFSDLSIRQPDHYLGAAGSSSAETMGRILIAVDGLLEKVRPEAVLVLGDTNSCLSVIPAKRRRIPVFHMEAGNRCFDQRVPEEINRRIVDHTADINMPYSSIAREYLLREGIAPDRIIKTGSPMFEVLHYYRDKILGSRVLDELGLVPDQFYLMSAHREENIDDERSFRRLVDLVNTLAEVSGLPIVISTHPRTRLRVERTGVSFRDAVRLVKPLSFSAYNKLQLSARAVLSDSGTISEESSILSFPALNIREAHERPEAMEEASVMMVGLSSDRALQALAILEHQPKGESRVLRPVADYSVPNVSEKVVRIILSYTDYVARTVWHRN